VRTSSVASSTPLVVFAKAPVPGKAKTRLIPALGATGAVRLQEAMIERTLRTARAAGLGSVELCCTPDPSHPFFAECAQRHGVTLTAQGGGNLGMRMLAAFERVVQSAGRTLLVGSDCPALTPDHMRGAAMALATGQDAVFTPAEDGGYVLVGLARVAPSLFEDIAWGGPDVMRTTRLRLTALGWRWRELAELWDVDRAEDLARLAREVDDGARLVEYAKREGAPKVAGRR
jgi:rSAM/selenodomain-associated transferase 1